MDNIEAMKLLDGNDLQVNKDGDSWCVLFGSDLQSGISGWGDTATEALIDFSKNWEGASYENTKKAFDSLDKPVEGEYRVGGFGDVAVYYGDTFIAATTAWIFSKEIVSLLNSQAAEIKDLKENRDLMNTDYETNNSDCIEYIEKNKSLLVENKKLQDDLRELQDSLSQLEELRKCREVKDE